MNFFRKKLSKIPRDRYGKQMFLLKLKKNARVLDIGCGNNSPKNTKFLRSDIYYAGVDVGEYNQEKGSIECADEYIISAPESFCKSILEIEGQFDAAISSHNLEHCNKPKETLDAICKKLVGGGFCTSHSRQRKV